MKKIYEQKTPEESLTMPKKLKVGPFGIFKHPFCRKASKIEGGPFGEYFFEKSLTMPKKSERGTL